MKNYTIILALQCLYHFLYLQKKRLYTKFFKLGYTYFHCYTVHFVELLNYYTNHWT